MAAPDAGGADRGHEAVTRTAYDLVAEDYARLLADWLDASPWEQAVLGAFAATVLAAGGGPVLDAGCGTGRITGHLAALGLDVSGVDLSPGMVDVARRTLPDLPFAVGTMADLAVADGTLAGALAWYSIIHTPPADRPAVFDELARVLAPGGHLVVAFQVGNERVRLEHAYGHDLTLDAYRLDPDTIAAELEAAGLPVTARLVRDPVAPEPQQQAYLLARKPRP
jgi:SAM-dependent methyltransferase